MISVIIPTLNEENRISDIVKFCLSSSLVSEVIVIDDGSTDKTFELAKFAGAKGFYSSMLGKGTSMLDGLWKSKEDLVVYLDGDIFNFSLSLLEEMVRPLMENRCDFVKGRFHRVAGRVTALTARPLLKVFFPEISHIDQPLGGIIAAKKELLKNIKFESDYGVDIGLLIDVAQFGARILEVDIGSVDHDHQTLDQLSNMSGQVVRVILERASRYKKLDLNQLKDGYEIQRVKQLQIDQIIAKIDPSKKLALFDMDGTLIEGRYIEKLAHYVSRQGEIENLLDNKKLDPIYRTKMIARTLSGLPKTVFERIAQVIPLSQNAQKLIVELKKRGFIVGIITDSYFVAAEIIRKRVFADFSIAHLLEFKRGIFTGDLEISPFFKADRCKKHDFCKLNILDHIDQIYGMDYSNIHFAGDGLNDVCLLESLGNTIAVNPKDQLVESAATSVVHDLDDILSRWT
ncbi:MAG TPA: HAD-IB family phosphatase [Pseudobdellovibrionaceae bacterium]|nr:HAD-IB family phosphatase [Pseudobdellovibrionaceae bacterium]